MNRKHDRQLRLKELGLAGQARLDASTVRLYHPPRETEPLERWLAREYLERAGVPEIESTSEDDHVPGQNSPLSRNPIETTLDSEAARELARGSSRALALIRQLLQLPQ
jgi:hypothetical protein